jgi:PAS domain-containing protein
MSTTAQITANTVNAQSSTGPRTEAGKAASSKNAVTLGLFSGDFVRAAEQPLHDELNATILRELAPIGILEQNLACEIRRAMWRLHRCGEVEARLVDVYEHVDPMEAWDKLVEYTQKSVDRARSQAHRLLHKATSELRRLQTERQSARELLRDLAEGSSAGIADWRAIARARIMTGTRSAQRTQSHSPINETNTPRNAECPCGSGVKYKRCCGINAPAVLQAA